MKTIVFQIHSSQIGFHLSLATLYSQNYQTVIITPNSADVIKILKATNPNYTHIIIDEQNLLNEIKQSITPSKLMEMALAVENKYSETISMILSMDRHYGKGYLYNVHNHPNNPLSFTTLEKRQHDIVAQINMWEQILSKYKAEVVFSQFNQKIPSMICRHLGIHYLSPALAKYDKKMLWSEDEFYQSKILSEKIKNNLKSLKSTDITDFDYIKDRAATISHAKARYDYWHTFKILFRHYYIHIKKYIYDILQNRDNSNNNPFWGWFTSLATIPKTHKFFLKYGKKPTELKGKKIIFFPLHFEPEVSLYHFSPEFTNSMELIANVSKSLPADCVLVVKEHIHQFGLRSLEYYKQLQKIGNLCFAHPEVHSWDWIKASSITTTITGTAAIECIYMNKPVLSFGKHQVVNLFPTCRYASDYQTTKDGIKQLLAMHPDDSNFQLSRESLYRAHQKICFELPRFGQSYKSHQLDMESAKIAADHLEKFYDIKIEPSPHNSTIAKQNLAAEQPSC
jgi:hypothetical protein